MQGRSVAQHRMRAGVELNPAPAQDKGGVLLAGTADDGADAGFHFHHFEVADEEVVRTEVEAEHALFHGFTARHHNDRDTAPHFPQAAADGKPVHARKDDRDEQGVVLVADGFFPAFQTVRGPVERIVSQRFEVGADLFGKLFFAFYHEQADMFLRMFLHGKPSFP